MKKLFTIFAAALIAVSVFAQAPEKMTYQSVIRNNNDQLLTNTTVGMQISILQGSATGTAAYVETQTPTSNANGLITVEIGAGTVVSGSFSGIDWTAGPYYIKTETDTAGGTNYTITGTSQLLSVPYSLHAKSATSLTGTYNETDPVFSSSLASGITATDTAYWNGKLDSEVDGSITNELQTISKSGNTVTLSDGGGSFTDDVNDADNSTTNELQTVSKSGNTVTLSNSGGSFTVDDADANPSNELQNISKSGSTVTLSMGGGSFTDDVNDADASPTNEIQSLAITGQSLSISSGNTITLPNNSLWTDLGSDLRPISFENVVSGGDFITSAGNGVINCGGGAMNANANIISDVVPTPTIATGDEDLYIDDDLEVNSQAYKPGGGSWATISDRRTKKEVKPYTDGLAQILKINPVKFKYKEEFANALDENREFVGVIAQDMLEVAPYMVEEKAFYMTVEENEEGEETTVTNPGIKRFTYDPSALDYMLINAVKEQQSIIDAQNEKIEELTQRLEEMEQLLQK